MATTVKIPLPWTTVWTATQTPKFIPCTGWMAAAAFDKIRATFELVNLGLYVSVQPAYQVANVENTIVGTWTVFQSAATTEVVTYPTAGWTDIGATAEDNQLIRFGWEIKLTQGAAFAAAMVGGVLEKVVS